MTQGSGGQNRGRPDLSKPSDGRGAFVLYIGGSGRSGSTLLDLMIGQVGGCCSVGELSSIWIRGLVENELCGCGTPFGSCPFWSQVGEEAFGGWNRVDPKRIGRLQATVDRTRYIPLMLAPTAPALYRARMARYAEVLGRLYGAIHRVSGAAVIVDSTKRPSTGFLLRKVPRLELRLIHLVRDSRGVAHSWTKEVRKPEVVERDAYLDTYNPFRMGIRWVMYNSLIDLLGLDPAIPSGLVRYEDLVRHPHRMVRRILELAGLTLADEDLAGIGSGWVRIAAAHTIAGNPMRFRHGRVPLRVDEEWRRQLRPLDRDVVSAITLPLLARYGYLRRRGEAAPRIERRGPRGCP
jgi:hypothetical protein